MTIALICFRDVEKRFKTDPEYDPRTLYIPEQEKTKFTPVSVHGFLG